MCWGNKKPEPVASPTIVVDRYDLQLALRDEGTEFVQRRGCGRALDYNREQAARERLRGQLAGRPELTVSRSAS